MMRKRTLFGGLAAVTLASGLAFMARGEPSKAVSEARPAADLTPRRGRLLVDIREPMEWQQTGVLAGAHLHSWRSPEAFVSDLKNEIAEADEILILCRSGNRSLNAARALAKHLDREVIDVSGGMIRLAREGQAQVVAPTRDMGCPVC